MAEHIKTIFTRDLPSKDCYAYTQLANGEYLCLVVSDHVKSWLGNSFGEKFNEIIRQAIGEEFVDYPWIDPTLEHELC